MVGYACPGCRSRRLTTLFRRPVLRLARNVQVMAGRCKAAVFGVRGGGVRPAVRDAPESEAGRWERGRRDPFPASRRAAASMRDFAAFGTYCAGTREGGLGRSRPLRARHPARVTGRARAASRTRRGAAPGRGDLRGRRCRGVVPSAATRPRRPARDRGSWRGIR